MPLKVAPDPKDPSKWIWVDAATGEPASQPGGEGTPFIAQSDPVPGGAAAPGAPPDVGGPSQGPTQPKKPVGSVALSDIASSLGTGWTMVPGSLAKEPDKLVQNTAPGAGITPGVPAYVPQPTGRWQVIFKTPQGLSRVVYLTPAGTPPAAGVDASSPGYNWNIVSAPTDIPESANKQPSPTAQLTQVKDPKTGEVIGLRDEATGTTIPVPKDPAGTLTTINNTPMVVKPDGSAVAVTGPDGKPLQVTKDKQQMSVPGIGLVEYDPSKTGTDAYNVIYKTPTGVQAKDIPVQKAGGKIWVASDDGKGGIIFTSAKDDAGNPLPADNTYTVAYGGNDPRSPTVTLIDQQGNTKVIQKDGWTPPPNPNAGTAVTPSTDAPFLVTIGDNGQPVFTENKNKLSISEAQKALIQQLGGKVADGSMSEKSAQDLITGLTNAMTARANLMTAQTNQQKLTSDAAASTLTSLQQGAQTGAGLLQNRVTSATGALNNIVSAAASSKMQTAPAGMAGDIVNGLQEWVTGLGGGQPVYDSAAAMVNQAAPGTFRGDPTLAQQAYTALRGMMDLYKNQTGKDWTPDSAAGGGTGFKSPTSLPDGTPAQTNVTPNPALVAAGQTALANPGTFNPQASTAALNQRGLLDNPEGRALASGYNVTPPTVPGQYNPVWQRGTPSAVGQPATGPIVGGGTAPLPYIPWGQGQFISPTTVAA